VAFFVGLRATFAALLEPGHGENFLRNNFQFKRAEIRYPSFWVDGRQVRKSSGSVWRQDAVHLRDQLLGKKARGEVADVVVAKVTCGESLDDLLES